MRNILRTLAILVFLLAGASVSAQYYYLPSTVNGNPGGLNSDGEYPVGGGLAATWTAISTAPAATPAWSSTQTLPFAFQFNGSAVTQFKVSTSGILTFDVAATTAPSYTKAALPDASIPDNSVCIWGLASVGTNSNRYQDLRNCPQSPAVGDVLVLRSGGQHLLDLLVYGS